MGQSKHKDVDNMLLINYAYRLLSAEAASRVAYAIKTDEEIKAQYSEILQLLKENPGIDPEMLLQKTERTGYDAIPQSKPAFMSLQKWLAAAILVLVVSIVLFYNYSVQHSPERLVMEMIEAKTSDPYSNTTRGEAGNEPAVIWKDKFANNDFRSVISILEKEKSRSKQQQFFLAIAYLKAVEPQPEKAAPLFMELTQSQSQFTSDAWLYLGLSQVLLHKNKKAIESLQHIEQTIQVRDLEERLRK